MSEKSRALSAECWPCQQGEAELRERQQAGLGVAALFHHVGVRAEAPQEVLALVVAALPLLELSGGEVPRRLEQVPPGVRLAGQRVPVDQVRADGGHAGL